MVRMGTFVVDVGFVEVDIVYSDGRAEWNRTKFGTKIEHNVYS